MHVSIREYKVALLVLLRYSQPADTQYHDLSILCTGWGSHAVCSARSLQVKHVCRQHDMCHKIRP